jgi:hypothetical protein
VKTHCAVCHNDRANNGGLSLEGFDAAVAAPSLAAMMLSKMKNGAAGAGIGVPDKSTVDGLVAAFAAQSAGATKWTVERAKHRSTGAELVTASIVRELSSMAGSNGQPGIDAPMYRLVLTCNAATREGVMQLAWSPLPKRGALSVAVDNKPPAVYGSVGVRAFRRPDRHVSVRRARQARPHRIAATSRPACSFSARYDVSTSRCMAVQRPDRCTCSSGTPASIS